MIACPYPRPNANVITDGINALTNFTARLHHEPRSGTNRNVRFGLTLAVVAYGRAHHEPVRPHARTLRGTIRDAHTGEPLAGATIVVEPAPEQSAITGWDGTYEVAIPVGQHRVTIFLAGNEVSRSIEAKPGSSLVLEHPFTPRQVPTARSAAAYTHAARSRASRDGGVYALRSDRSSIVDSQALPNQGRSTSRPIDKKHRLGRMQPHVGPCRRTAARRLIALPGRTSETS